MLTAGIEAQRKDCGAGEPLSVLLMIACRESMSVRRLIALTALLVIGPPVRGSGFDFAALHSLLTTRRIDSIEDLLPALPESLRHHYALVFASRSLQGASFESPRVILFGPDARFIVAFNGDPNQRGYNVLETMEFNDSSGQFLLREIEIPSHAAGAAPVLISEPNPSRCQRCHGTPARPVWDSHPLWPGVYGERYNASLSIEEQAGIGQFLAKKGADARYRHLKGADRFANRETFRPSTQSRYSGTPPESPNAELSRLLEPLVSRSIVAELTSNPAFGIYRYLLLGASEGHCGSLDEFYPAERGHEIRTAFYHYVQATDRDNRSEGDAKKRRLTPGNQAVVAVPAVRSAATLNMLRFVAEMDMNMSTRTWTLALEKGTYDFTSSPEARGSLRDALLAEVARRDGRIRSFSDYATSADGDRYCSYLMRRSRGALAWGPLQVGSAAAGVAATPGTQANSARPSQGRAATVVQGERQPTLPTTLKLCADCHQSGVAPKIPFSDPEQLRRELLSRPSGHGHLIDEIRFRLGPEAGAKRMPLGVNVSEAERLVLEQYFDELAAQTP